MTFTLIYADRPWDPIGITPRTPQTRPTRASSTRGRHSASLPTAVHPTPIPIAPAVPPPGPIIVPDSDSDSDDSSIEIIKNTELDKAVETQQLSELESWMRTPEGSPPRRTSRRHTAAFTHRDEPPPEYTEYLRPTVESFGFHPDVAAFLSRRNLSSTDLARIDTTLNCHLYDWVTGFEEAGLTTADAQRLRTVVIRSLPDLSRDALLTAWAAGDN